MTQLGKQGSADQAMRVATPGDAACLARLNRVAFAAQETITDPPPSALGESPASVLAQLEAGGALVLGNPPIGGLIWSEREGGLYVGRLAVDPSFRRRGLASLLLAAAEAVAREKRLAMVTLSTRLVLGGNRRLFARHGFVEIAQHAHAGYDRPTFVSMEKRLGP